MKAMVLHGMAPLTDGARPLVLEDVPDPEPGPGELLVRVSTCGVCHTELDEIEGRLPPASLPAILGHQVVGRVEALGAGAIGFHEGDRVGVPWIHSACGACRYCAEGRENLCSGFRATGKDVNGGYAELVTVPDAFAHAIPDSLTDVEAAPLLCAGAIGYRSLRLAGIENGMRLGLTGFGASGHLVLKLALHLMPDTEVFVFARSPEEREFALDLGAAWAGDTLWRVPAPLHAVIDTTPVWTPVVEALGNLAPGGRLVINAIRKESSDQDALLYMNYAHHLWMEKEIKSVANVTRRDVRQLLSVAHDAGLRPEVQEFGLADANEALVELKTRTIRGAKVLRIG